MRGIKLDWIRWDCYILRILKMAVNIPGSENTVIDFWLKLSLLIGLLKLSKTLVSFFSRLLLSVRKPNLQPYGPRHMGPRNGRQLRHRQSLLLVARPPRLQHLPGQPLNRETLSRRQITPSHQPKNLNASHLLRLLLRHEPAVLRGDCEEGVGFGCECVGE
jgi:hypothetical protein